MKQHMLRQLPGSDMLFLPPFDTKHKQLYARMDHLVNTKFNVVSTLSDLCIKIDMLCSWYARYGSKNF